MYRILNPEWQGCGRSTDVAGGARALAAAWWTAAPDLTVEAPPEEHLPLVDGVTGLDSIATRLTGTLKALRTAAPDRVTMVGGTCGTELAPVAWCHERYGDDLAVVWLDAHADLNTPASSPSGHFHGMVLRTLLGDGPTALVSPLGRPLEPHQVYLVGARDLDQAEHDYIGHSELTWVGPDFCDRPDDLVDLIRRGGSSHVFLHFDVDVIDPATFSSALLPVPHGPSLAAVSDTLSTLHRHLDVVGFSVLEYCRRGNADLARLVTSLTAAQADRCCG